MNWVEAAAQQFDLDPADNVVTVTTQLQPRANLAVSKRAGAQDLSLGFVGGHELTYTLAITNFGPSPANNVLVTDTLPVSVTFRRASAGCSSAGGRTVNCTLAGPLALLTPWQPTITAYISPEVRGPIINVVCVSSDEQDLTLGNNVFTRTSTVTGRVDLDISKRASPTVGLSSGDALTFTVAITNNGPSSALGITMTDILTRGLTYQSSQPPCSATIQTLGPGQGSKSFTVTQLSCVLGRLDPGVSTPIIIVTTLDNRAGTLITNTATVTTPEAIALASDTVTVQTNASATLSIGKAAQPEPVAVNGTLTYTLGITNSGPYDAYDVRVIDTLPNGITFRDTITAASSLSITSGPAPNSTGVISWSLPTLSVNESGAIVFTTTVGSNFSNGALLTNSATINSSTPHPPAGTTASVTSTVFTYADLGVYKFRTTDPITVNRAVTYTLIYSNAGPLTAQSIRLTDSLPVSLTYGGIIATTPTLSTPTQSGQAVVWTISSLAPQVTGTIWFTATVNSGGSGAPIVNTATIRAATTDRAVGNNTSSDTGFIVLLQRLWQVVDRFIIRSAWWKVVLPGS